MDVNKSQNQPGLAKSGTQSQAKLNASPSQKSNVSPPKDLKSQKSISPSKDLKSQKSISPTKNEVNKSLDKQSTLSKNDIKQAQ